MSQLTLRLPQILHQQLIHLAEGEQVSLNQYIVYALTRQVTLAYALRELPEAEINQQKQAFKTLLQKLGQASPSEIAGALAEREQVQGEDGLSPEIVDRLQRHIQNAVNV
jgi:hypothetical protein